MHVYMFFSQGPSYCWLCLDSGSSVQGHPASPHSQRWTALLLCPVQLLHCNVNEERAWRCSSPSVLVFQGCPNQVPQPVWRTRAEISSLTALEARSLKSRCPKAGSFWGWESKSAPGPSPTSGALLAILGIPWPIVASPRSPFSSSHAVLLVCG